MSGASTAAPRSGALPPPPEVPGFEIGPLLGAGGMGRVYRARDVESGRDVAVKWLDGGASDELRSRFAREAKAASALEHPNIVKTWGSGRTAAGDFIVMELVEGFPLSVALDARALGPKAVAEVGAKVARALAAAHAAGVVHRDVKPGNILLDAASEPRLVDFGLARFVSEKNALTGPQAIMGTLAYMSPEVARGGAADAGPASDVFSLGCVLYEGLTGKPPFLGARAQDTLSNLEHGRPAPLPGEVPPGLAAVVLEALAKKPAQRPTATALATRLETLSLPVASTAVPAASGLAGLETGPITQPLAAATRPLTAPAPAIPRTAPATPVLPPTSPAASSPPSSSGTATADRGPLAVVLGLFLALGLASAVAVAAMKHGSPAPAASPAPSSEPVAVASPPAPPLAPTPAPVASHAPTHAPSPAASPAPNDDLALLDQMSGPEVEPSPSPSPTPPAGAKPTPAASPSALDEDLRALKAAVVRDEREETIRLAKKVLGELPSTDRTATAQVQAALGRAQLLLGRARGAEKSYATALEADPDNLNALYGTVALALVEGKGDGAAQRAKALVDRHPNTLAAISARILVHAVSSGRREPRDKIEAGKCYDPVLSKHALSVALAAHR